MTLKRFFAKLERLETHHRIAFFSIALIGSIIVTRLGVLIHDPNPMFFGMELHHFDYGILLLLIVAQLSLFGPRRLRDLYIFLTAIASGLILDEYWMIRHGISSPGLTRGQEYNSTFFSVMILATVAVLATLFVSSLLRRKK